VASYLLVVEVVDPFLEGLEAEEVDPCQEVQEVVEAVPSLEGLEVEAASPFLEVQAGEEVSPSQEGL
jgi:hypothetical protein